MKNDIALLSEQFSNSTIVFSELLPRQTWRNLSLYEGEKRRVEINVSVSNFLIGMGGMVLWHRNIQGGRRDLFRHDGVHLTDHGNDIFLEDLCNF